ncbi:site-specific integrase [Sphingobium sp. AN558]|uniref:tyrosine-type recombinase/integrase n=1 Tax=Sphingobium sp. AN558 TaxID=3133442 RepID=UPI0030BD474D
MGEAVRAYLAAKADMASIKRATVAWKAAAPFWDALPIARVDETTPQDYGKRRSHCKPITIRNELAVIRAALNWAERKKLIGKAPFIKMPSFPSSSVGHLSKAEFRRLLDASQALHVRLFLQLAVGTGARTNALLDLTWDRVDFDRNIIILNPHERVQTSKYRATVPMNAQLRAALIEAKDGALSDFVIEHGRARVGSIRNGFRAAAKRAGLKATPHMLRHSAAVWMAEANTPFSQIAQFLGHTDSRITERVYSRFSPSFLAGAAEALTW